MGNKMFRIAVALCFFVCFALTVEAQQYSCIKRNDNLALTFGANGYNSCASVTDTGAVLTREYASSSGVAKAEDSVHGTGETGSFSLGVANTTISNLCATGDYCPVALTVTGATQATLDYASQLAAGTGLLKLEDLASSTGESVVAIGAVREDALTTSTSTTGDYSHVKVDGNGRLITTTAPPGETWQSCGTATATTADVAIKAAVASNRIYVTAIACKNTSATVATTLDFKDGSTVISVGGINQVATASSGDFTKVFSIPLRGTVNTAFNFATNIATTSVTCCANGYISVL